jgi:UDP-N-acetylglucosamine--N-acetylmuramyl-(pentapeptide) pyrophosphoryl-undecaprenol N-acetylglucosamine transferase
MRILVTGGGTVDALKQLDSHIEILYVGQEGSLESKIVRSVGLKFRPIAAGKFRRYNGAGWRNFNPGTALRNLIDGFKVAKGIWQSAGLIREFKPDVIFCKGGYVSLPVGLAARLLRVKYVIHESDVDPGLTNRVLSGGASKIAVGFPIQYYQEWPESKLVYTGNPVRAQVVGRHRLEGLAKFNLDESLPVVLIMGGSQGAKSINDAVVEALPNLLGFCQVVHIAGEREIERVRFEVSRLGLEHPERYKVFSFLLEDLGLAYAAADVVVSRAGANSIAELAALSKPTILVPAAHLHDQPRNAQVIARKGAAKVIQGERLNATALENVLKQILSSSDEQRLLAGAMREFGAPDAAKRLAEVIVGQGSGVVTEEGSGFA